MTRILQVLGRSAGGIARHVAQVASALHGDDLHVDVAGPSDLPVAMPREMHEVSIPDGPLGHRRVIARLRRIVDDNGYDVVHAHGLRAGIDAARAARRRGVPVFVTVHNLVRPEIAGKKAALYRVAEDLAVRLSDRTFAVSEDIARHLRARVAKASERVEVLHLGAGPPPALTSDAGTIRKALEVPEDAALLVTASRLAPQKALHIMLHALNGLLVPSVLAVLGVGPEEDSLRTLATRLGVADRVRWLGFRPDIADHIAAADVFCLSSIWEGVPLAAMEAVQLGTPVVGTAVGGMPELIEDRRSGRLVEPLNPRALADALREVLTDDDLRRGYVSEASSRLESEFSTEKMLSRLRTAYVGAARA